MKFVSKGVHPHSEQRSWGQKILRSAQIRFGVQQSSGILDGDRLIYISIMFRDEVEEVISG